LSTEKGRWHSRPSPGCDLLKYVDRSRPILIDSGGQYDYGTTDVTRMWFFGENPSEDFKDMYTRVLKGNIGVGKTVNSSFHLSALSVSTFTITSLCPHFEDVRVLGGVVG
jgi:hypothetical protein